ncbi:MAG: hypothetical protein JW940_07765, partial [Polyangiaceae bacterium]|nr:hypothetical protein [Polyangiaceae bacterium]
PRLGATWLGEWERIEDDRSRLKLVELSVDALWVTKIADFLTLSAGPFLDLGLMGRYVAHQSGATRSEYATASSVGLSVCVSGLLYGL